MKTYYHTWTETDLWETYGFDKLYTECNSQGEVLREVGIDPLGNVIYRFPPQMLDGQRGIFEFMKIDVDHSVSNFTSEDFEKIWKGD